MVTRRAAWSCLRRSASSASGSRRYSGTTLSPAGGRRRRGEPCQGEGADAGGAATRPRGSRAPAGSSTSRKRTAPSPTASRPGRARLGQHLRRDRGGRDDLARRPRTSATNASPRRASSTASTGPARRPPAASARSVETPTSSAPVACASARAVATPIRRPVNVPGPTPTRDAVEVGERQARLVEQPRRRAAAAATAWPGRSPGAGSWRSSRSRRSATTVAGRGGVEREERSCRAHSIVTRRASPPACSSVDAHRARRASPRRPRATRRTRRARR